LEYGFQHQRLHLLRSTSEHKLSDDIATTISTEIAIETANEGVIRVRRITTDIGTMGSTEARRKATAGIDGKTERTIKMEDVTRGGSE
jgi:hypothetical protein